MNSWNVCECLDGWVRLLLHVSDYYTDCDGFLDDSIDLAHTFDFLTVFFFCYQFQLSGVEPLGGARGSAPSPTNLTPIATKKYEKKVHNIQPNPQYSTKNNVAIYTMEPFMSKCLLFQICKYYTVLTHLYRKTKLLLLNKSSSDKNFKQWAHLRVFKSRFISLNLLWMGSWYLI